MNGGQLYVTIPNLSTACGTPIIKCSFKWNYEGTVSSETILINSIKLVNSGSPAFPDCPKIYPDPSSSKYSQ